MTCRTCRIPQPDDALTSCYWCGRALESTAKPPLDVNMDTLIESGSPVEWTGTFADPDYVAKQAPVTLESVREVADRLGVPPRAPRRFPIIGDSIETIYVTPDPLLVIDGKPHWGLGQFVRHADRGSRVLESLEAEKVATVPENESAEVAPQPPIWMQWREMMRDLLDDDELREAVNEALREVAAKESAKAKGFGVEEIGDAVEQHMRDEAAKEGGGEA